MLCNITLSLKMLNANCAVVLECGPGKWLQVSSLNVTDASQTCPSGWSLVDSPGRSCTSPSCNTSVFFDVSGVEYSQVCGQALGFASTSPDAFQTTNAGINGAYLDGVSITYGQSRQHIWSLAAGHGAEVYSVYRCPCDNPDRTSAPLPPSFVGNNYFCDGDYNGALWDNKNCATDCCSFNSPPWFIATLPAVTKSSIEVRICVDQPFSDERVFLSSLILYIK